MVTPSNIQYSRSIVALGVDLFVIFSCCFYFTVSLLVYSIHAVWIYPNVYPLSVWLSKCIIKLFSFAVWCGKTKKGFQTVLIYPFIYLSSWVFLCVSFDKLERHLPGRRYITTVVRPWKHIYVQPGWLLRLTRLDPCWCKNVYPSVILALRFDTDSACEWSPIDARSVNFDFDRVDVMSAIIAEKSEWQDTRQRKTFITNQEFWAGIE